MWTANCISDITWVALSSVKNMKLKFYRQQTFVLNNSSISKFNLIEKMFLDLKVHKFEI